MKRTRLLICAISLLLSDLFVFTSCSNEDSNEEIPYDKETGESETPKPEGGFMEIPQEVLDKVKGIYGKASVGPQKVTTVHQMAILTSICATRKEDGPITVTSAELNGEEVTLITLGGTEDVEGQATSLEESQLAAFGKSNDYLVAFTKLFEENVVPQSKPVVIAGISLGGMIAQQILSQSWVMEHYDIMAIITFGSPITLPLDRKGVKVVRFADVHDKVPQLGESVLRSGILTSSQMNRQELLQKLSVLDELEKVSCTSKYTGMIETHALSYIEDSCWNDTDFLGDSSKKNVLELKETMKFYPAPKLSTDE